MRTLALTNNEWDLYVDDLGNLAIKDNNDRLAQDVASSARVWIGECPFNTERGVDYGSPDTNRDDLKLQINEQAGLVEGVYESTVVFEEFKDRNLKVNIYVTNENGEQIVVGE